MPNVNRHPPGTGNRAPLFPLDTSYLSSNLAIDAMGFVEENLHRECHRLIADLTPILWSRGSVTQRFEAARRLADHVALDGPTFGSASKPGATAQLLGLLRFYADRLDRSRLLSGAAAKPSIPADEAYRQLWATHALRAHGPALDRTTSCGITFTPRDPTAGSKTVTTKDINRCLTPLPSPIQLADWKGAGTWLGSSFINYCWAVFDDHTPAEIDFRSSEWLEAALRGQPSRKGPQPHHRITLVPLNTPIPPKPVKGKAFAASGSHWVCVQINHASQRFTVHDSMFPENAANNARIAATLKDALTGTWQHVPQRNPLRQSNEEDCGVYTIVNAWLVGCIGRTLTASEFMVDALTWRVLLATMVLRAEDPTKRTPASPPTPGQSRQDAIELSSEDEEDASSSQRLRKKTKVRHT